MRRKAGLFLGFTLLLSVALTSSAFGQGNTLLVDDQTPAPGQEITVTGSGFTAAAGLNPINIRLDTRDGTSLASPTPNSLGQISQAVALPPTLKPGWHLIIATQTVVANGRQRSFTPARTRIKVEGAAVGAATPTGGGGSPLPDSPLGFLALASALLALAAGAAFGARRIRTMNRPRLDSQAR